MNNLIERLKTVRNNFSRKRQFEKLARMPVPWTVPAATDFMEKVLSPGEKNVLEFGGGASTLWFLKKAKKVFTYEANCQWSSQLLNYMDGRPELASRWRFYFVNCDWNIDELGNRWWIKNGHSFTHDDLKKEMERDFLNFPYDDRVDLVFNDGSVRALTLQLGINQLLKNPQEGYLVVDNSEKPWRDRYTKKLVPDDWKRIDFINEGDEKVDWVEDASRATVWIKPEGYKQKV